MQYVNIIKCLICAPCQWEKITIFSVLLLGYLNNTYIVQEETKGILKWYIVFVLIRCEIVIEMLVIL